MDTSYKRSTLRQVLLALLTNFSSVGPSMTLGFSAVTIPYLKNTLNEDQISWFASIASLAGPFGCFFSGPIADKFGRRSAIFCINLTCFLGWLVIYMAYSSQNHQYSLLLFGRLLTGFATGLSSAPPTIYMAEVSSPKLRGVFTTWGSIAFSTGILLVYMLGFFLKNNWGLIALISCFLPCLGTFFIAFFVPESPSWLVGKNRLDEARHSMCRVFGVNENDRQAQSEIEALIKAKGVKLDPKRKSLPEQMMRKVKFFLKPHCLKPLGFVFAFFFFQQFSGTFVIVFYAIDIVKKAGVTLDPYLTIVMIGLIRLVTAVVVSYISKHCGKRPLSVISGIGMTLCMLTLACYNLLIDQGKISAALQAHLTLLPFLSLLFYFFTSTLGFLPMPFALGAELFPTKVRGTASGLLSGFGYLFNFVTVKIYPNMIESMGSTGVFSFYGVTALFGTIFLVCLLPETKGKSLEEILEHFGEKRNVTEGEEK